MAQTEIFNVAGVDAIETGQIQVPRDTARIQVVGAVKGRRNLTLVNFGTVAVFLGGDAVTPDFGFALPAGAGIPIQMACALYACVNPAGAADGSLTWLGERAVGGAADDPASCG